jgi:hypothetical protein
MTVFGRGRLLHDEENMDGLWSPDGVVTPHDAEAQTGAWASIQHHNARELKAPEDFRTEPTESDL